MLRDDRRQKRMERRHGARSTGTRFGVSTATGSDDNSNYVQPSFENKLQTTLVPAFTSGSATPTFTRATTAYVTGYASNAVAGDSQILIQCAAGEARFTGARRVSEGVWSNLLSDNTPISDATMLGYQAEGARTNRCLQSQTLENVAWTASNMTVADASAGAPDGTSTATTLTAAAGNATLIQDLGIVASAVKTGSFWIKRKTGTGNVDLTLNGGTGWTTITVTAAWTLVQLTATLADEDFGIRIVTLADAVYVWNAQVETASFASSAIPTTTVAVTRNTDILTYPNAGNISGTVGSVYAEVTISGVNSATNPPVIGTTSASATTAPLILEGTSGQPRIWDNTTFATSGLANIAIGTTAKLASMWGASGKMQVFKDGTAGNLQNFDGDLSPTGIALMGYTDGTSPNFGNIRNVRIWPQALSANTLQGMT